MENAIDAIKMGFGMLVFVIAISATMYLFSIATSTSQVLLYTADKTNFYDNIELDEEKRIANRVVGFETIIPTLYRYYKENFAVQIYESSGKLTQIFDVNVEGKVRKAASTQSGSRTHEQNALLSLYGVSSGGTPEMGDPYLFQSPWIGNTSKDIKTRIDLYVKGECGYINGTRVDYTKNNLQEFIRTDNKNPKFEEQFAQYAYKGDTISVGEGDGIETITGNSKTETKIVITYKEIEQ